MLFVSLVTAVATIALAWVAWLQIQERESARSSEMLTADARLSANAFEVRRRLGALILESHHAGWTVNGIGKLVNEAPQFRERLERALTDAAGASPGMAAALRRAYVLYQRGIGSFESLMLDHARRNKAENNLLNEARENLRACCHELHGVIEPQLLAEAQRIGALPVV